MQLINDHIAAIGTTFSYLQHRKFLVFFLPGVVIAILFLLIYQRVDSVFMYTSYLESIPWVGSYLGKGADVLHGWVEGISIYIYHFSIITLLSPFHTLLSERVEEEITSEQFPFSWGKIFSDIMRTLGVIFLGGLFYLLIKFMWFLLAWLIGLSFLTPYFSFLLISFFTGFNSYDYSLERHDVSVVKSWKFGRQNIGYMVVSGSLFTSLMLIPVIGVVLAPVFLTMISTHVFVKMKDRKPLFQ